MVRIPPAAARLRPRNNEELFNFRHSSLRKLRTVSIRSVQETISLACSIQCIWVWFFSMQKTFVCCPAVLHNVIRSLNLDDD